MCGSLQFKDSEIGMIYVHFRPQDIYHLSSAMGSFDFRIGC
jgi:hypothetical protein